VYSDRSPVAEPPTPVRLVDPGPAAPGSGAPARFVSPVRRNVFGGREARRRAFDRTIESHASAYNVRPELVRAVIHAESNFNPHAVSPKGAMGLMQLMPETAGELGVGRPFDPDDNIRGGVAYLRQLLDRYENDEELALAAYNAGPGAVARYGNRVPPFRETRQYVSRIKSVLAAGATPGVKAGGSRPAIYRLVGTAGSAVPLYSNVEQEGAAPLFRP
jgi:soluble lytic murein transglycosylase-like protein